MIKIDIRDSDKEDKLSLRKKNRKKRWNVDETVKKCGGQGTYLDKGC